MLSGIILILLHFVSLKILRFPTNPFTVRGKLSRLEQFERSSSIREGQSSGGTLLITLQLIILKILSLLKKPTDLLLVNSPK
jgi:hypothetical protein